VKNTTGQQGSTSEALRNFGNLPDDALVRAKVVAGLFGTSVVTVWRMTKDGRLPRPRRISSRHTAWNVGELRKALASL